MKKGTPLALAGPRPLCWYFSSHSAKVSWTPCCAHYSSFKSPPSPPTSRRPPPSPPPAGGPRAGAGGEGDTPSTVRLAQQQAILAKKLLPSPSLAMPPARIKAKVYAEESLSQLKQQIKERERKRQQLQLAKERHREALERQALETAARKAARTQAGGFLLQPSASSSSSSSPSSAFPISLKEATAFANEYDDEAEGAEDEDEEEDDYLLFGEEDEEDEEDEEGEDEENDLLDFNKTMQLLKTDPQLRRDTTGSTKYIEAPPSYDKQLLQRFKHEENQKDVLRSFSKKNRGEEGDEDEYSEVEVYGMDAKRRRQLRGRAARRAIRMQRMKKIMRLSKQNGAILDTTTGDIEITLPSVNNVLHKTNNAKSLVPSQFLHYFLDPEAQIKRPRDKKLEERAKRMQERMEKHKFRAMRQKKTTSPYITDANGEGLTRRQIRVAKLISSVLQAIIFELEVPDMPAHDIWISNVEVTRNMRIAKIYWESTNNVDLIEQGLTKHAPRIRRMLAQQIQLKEVPELVFTRERESDEDMKLEKVMQEINEVEGWTEEDVQLGIRLLEKKERREEAEKRRRQAAAGL
ncbi:putative DNA repair and recombination protein RAD54 [Balamuthia mandrillaris]